MKKVLAVLVVLTLNFPGSYGQFNIDYLELIPAEIEETSGLIMIDDKLVTHNDSGTEPYLYEFDTVSAVVTRSVYVEGGTNVDWEDITIDDTYIYIADIGNNNGTRTDLAIYRILIVDYQTTPNDTVTVSDTIYYNYADQTDFTSSFFNTNYDAESVIHYNDSLFIFTKNWINFKTNIYGFPKAPGTYSPAIIDSIDVGFLVCGAHYNNTNNEIVFTGHTVSDPYVYLIKNITTSNFAMADGFKYQPGYAHSIQTEGICSSADGCYFVSMEDQALSTPAALYKICLDDDIGFDKTKKPSFKFYPNPGYTILQLNFIASKIMVHTMNGKVIHESSGNQVDVRSFEAGTYLISCFDDNQTLVLNDRFVIQ